MPLLAPPPPPVSKTAVPRLKKAISKISIRQIAGALNPSEPKVAANLTPANAGHVENPSLQLRLPSQHRHIYAQNTSSQKHQRPPPDTYRLNTISEQPQSMSDDELESPVSPLSLEHPSMRKVDSLKTFVADTVKQSKSALEYAAEIAATPFEDDDHSDSEVFAYHAKPESSDITRAKLANDNIAIDKGKQRSAPPYVNNFSTSIHRQPHHSPEASTSYSLPAKASSAAAVIGAQRTVHPALRPLILVERKMERDIGIPQSTEDAVPKSPPHGLDIVGMSRSKGKRPVPRPIDLSNVHNRYGRVHVELEDGEVLYDTGYRVGDATMLESKLVPSQADAKLFEEQNSPNSDDSVDADVNHSLMSTIAQLTAEDRAGKLNKEQKRRLEGKRRILQGDSPKRAKLEEDERYALDQRHKWFDPVDRPRPFEDRERLSLDIDHAIADWCAAGPSLSQTEEARIRGNLEQTSQQLRFEYGLPPLAVPLPGDQKHPLHMFDKKAKKLMCRGKHNPAITLPKLPAFDANKDVYWKDFEQHLFEDVGPKAPVPPVQCATRWCKEYCCEYGRLQVESKVHSTDVLTVAAATRAKELVETLRMKRPNGIEDFETFMNCVGCGGLFCGRCIIICGVELCQQVCCLQCRDHKNNACPIHHPDAF